jgi:hypothetical protein
MRDLLLVATFLIRPARAKQALGSGYLQDWRIG